MQHSTTLQSADMQLVLESFAVKPEGHRTVLLPQVQLEAVGARQ